MTHRASTAGLTQTIASVLLAAASIYGGGAARADIAIKDGQKLAFLGDSITAMGAGSTIGYVNLVVKGLEANGVKVQCIPAGVSGHKSNDMLARLERDVLAKKPDWMTLSCGVNDVWHGTNGVPLDKYKENITEIVSRAQAAGIKVMILTSTMIYEDENNENNKKAVAYNDFLRTLAKEKSCLLADLNAAMRAEVKQAAATAPPNHGNLLTGDGVHMNPRGDQMMARGILQAFGVDAAQMEKARAAWMKIPNAMTLAPRKGISLEQYAQLEALAAKQNKSATGLVNAAFEQSMEALLKAADANEGAAPKTPDAPPAK